MRKKRKRMVNGERRRNGRKTLIGRFCVQPTSSAVGPSNNHSS